MGNRKCIQDSNGVWREARNDEEYNKVKAANKNKAKIMDSQYDCNGKKITVDSQDCGKEDKKITDQGYTKVDENKYKSSSTTHDRKYYWCKKENKNHYFIKKKTTPAKKYKCKNGSCVEDRDGTYTTSNCDGACGSTPTPTPTPTPGTGYQECYGPKYQKGCKDPGATKRSPNTDGSIYQVQGCIGATQDSYFGKKTLAALKEKTGKNYFTDNDVDKICEGSSDNQPQIDSPEEQTAYWKKLIKDKRIYPYGLIAQLNSNQVVYIIGYDVLKDKSGNIVSEKRIKLNPDLPVKGQITKDVIKNPEKEFIVHFIIQPNENEGKWSRFVIRDKYGDEVVDLEPTDPSRTWEPDDALYGVDDIFESYIKKAIKKKINEQRYKGRGATKPETNQPGTNQPGTNQPGTNQPGTNQPGTQTPSKPDPNKVRDVIDPIRLETIELLKKIKNDTAFNIGAKPEDKKSLDDAITLLENFNSSTACDNIKIIDENLVMLNDLISKNEGRLGVGNIISLAKQVRTNLEKVKSECKRLTDEANVSNQTTTNTTQNQGSTSTTQGSQTLSKDDLFKLFGFVKEDGTTYDPKAKIEKLGKQTLGESGSGTLQNAINNSGARSEYFRNYNDMITLIGLSDEYKLTIPMTSVTNPGAIITKENESVMFPPKDQESLTQYEKLTFGKYLATTSTASIYVGKKAIASGQGATQACPYDTTGIRDYLIKYLIRAFNASALDQPNKGEKETLCKCFKDGTLSKDNFEPITKDDWNNTATKTKINIENVPRNLFNQQLRWNDIQNLMKGEEVAGKQLMTVWTDRDFGSSRCVDSLTESLRKTVKSNISEAINKKNIITESVKNQILNRLSRRQ